MTDTTRQTTTLTPHISCRKAAEAVEFYQKAFGAELTSVLNTPDGRVMHAALKFGSSTLYLVDEFPEHGGQSPQSLGGSPVTLHLHVADCDAVFAHAVESGCTAAMPPADMFWGDRWGMLTDPYGHQWSVATTIREMSPEEMRKAMEEAPGCGEQIK
ncbi:MAG: VOC family protein [Akkermansiaceae bacterium]|nr:VOC family protein [Armatimonadota bacterium]